MRKKVIMIIVLSAFIGSGMIGIAASGDKPSGKPFQALWDAIYDVQDQINNIDDGDWTLESSGNMYSNAWGSVGIGTTAPHKTLEVFGDAMFTNTTNDTYLFIEQGHDKFNNPTDGKRIGAWDEVGGVWKTLEVDGKPLLLNTRSGQNVGIGTNSPEEKLHMACNTNEHLYVSGVYPGAGLRIGRVPYVHGVEAGAGDAIYGSGNLYLSTSGDLKFLYSPNHNLIIYSGSTGGEAGAATERLRIDSNGNVGIGAAANPSYKLDVDGAVQGHSFATGDIVFQKDGQQLWRMFEDEKGLYVQSLTTDKKYAIVLEEIDVNGGTAKAVTQTHGLADKVQKLQAKNNALEERLAKLEALLSGRQ